MKAVGSPPPMPSDASAPTTAPSGMKAVGSPPPMPSDASEPTTAPAGRKAVGGPPPMQEKPRLTLDLRQRIGTVIWATGFRPDYSWLQVPALDRKGQLIHDGGIARVPGLYALGLPFMRRRKSSFIHGAEDDVRDLAEHLGAYVWEGSSARRLSLGKGA
jgi:hypothetical protein